MPTLNLPGGARVARAIVFDKDGVLVDFDRYWGALTRQRLEAMAADLDPAEELELLALLGYPGHVDPDGPLPMATRFESMAVATGFLYRRGLPWVEARDRVRSAFAVAETRLPADALRQCGGAAETLAELRARHWRIGVATTDTAAHAWHTLEALGLAPWIDALVGGDEVERGKPDPQMFDLVCSRLGVAPAEAAMVGDGINDLKLVRAAGGAGAIGVLGGVSRREVLAPEADVVLEQLSDLLALCSA